MAQTTRPAAFRLPQISAPLPSYSSEVIWLLLRIRHLIVFVTALQLPCLSWCCDRQHNCQSGTGPSQVCATAIGCPQARQSLLVLRKPHVYVVACQVLFKYNVPVVDKHEIYCVIQLVRAIVLLTDIGRVTTVLTCLLQKVPRMSCVVFIATSVKCYLFIGADLLMCSKFYLCKVTASQHPHQQDHTPCSILLWCSWLTVFNMQHTPQKNIHLQRTKINSLFKRYQFPLVMSQKQQKQ